MRSVVPVPAYIPSRKTRELPPVGCRPIRRALVLHLFQNLHRKVWGVSCDEISADCAAQRIKVLDLYSAIANALRNSITTAKSDAKKNGKVIKTLIDLFRYPRQEPGMMWDAAAARTREQGGDIHMG